MTATPLYKKTSPQMSYSAHALVINFNVSLHPFYLTHGISKTKPTNIQKDTLPRQSKWVHQLWLVTGTSKTVGEQQPSSLKAGKYLIREYKIIVLLQNI